MAHNNNLSLKLINRGEEGEVLMKGRLDSVTSPEAEEILLELVDRFNRLILNMSDLQYLSSMGLRVLKQMYMRARKNDGELVLKNVNKLTMEVFEMTGFAGILTII